MEINNPESARTQLTLAVSTELAYLTIKELMGNALASSLNSAPLTRTVVQELLVARIRRNLSKQTGV